MFIVKLDHGVYIAPWSGDPGRTLVVDNAKVFTTQTKAALALSAARRYRPFPSAEILEIKTNPDDWKPVHKKEVEAPHATEK